MITNPYFLPGVKFQTKLVKRSILGRIKRIKGKEEGNKKLLEIDGCKNRKQGRKKFNFIIDLHSPKLSQNRVCIKVLGRVRVS